MASIRKRQWKTPSGEVKSAWSLDWVDTAGKRHRRQFMRKGDADAFRVEIEGQLRTGTFRPDAQKMTVAELADSFLEYCEARCNRSERMTRGTLVFYRTNIDRYILARRTEISARNARSISFHHGIAGLRLSQLTPRTLGDFRDNLRAAGVTVPTTRKIISTLHGMLQFARSQDLIGANPASNLRVIGRRDEGSKKIVPPSKELVRALIQEADRDFRVVIMFAAATGVRAGELHAMRWLHLDYHAVEVRVVTRVDRYRQEDEQGTKSSAGIRGIPLGAALVAELKAWRLRSAFSKDTDLLFPNRSGSYSDHSDMVTRRFKPLFERLEAKHVADPRNHLKPRPFNWHALRHFAISTWIEARLQPKTIQTFAGHASLAVTMDRYGHLFPSEDHRIVMDGLAVGLLRS